MQIAILGTGAFSLAISHLLEFNNIKFTIVGRDINQLNDLKNNNKNSKYSNHIFKNRIDVLELNQENLNTFDIVFYCLPSKYINIINNLNPNIHIVITSKGYIDKFIFERLTNYTILSGGSYSEEILKDIPCYITLASKSKTNLLIIEEILKSSKCLISKSNQPESIELLGIFKNIIAVFCGIITELNMGKNIEAAFISKVLENLNELIDFDKTCIIEPAGIGDLFLSCSSIKSRNYSFGINLIKKKEIELKKLAEGYNSLNNIILNKNFKITNELNNIINEITNHSSNKKISLLIINFINNI